MKMTEQLLKNANGIYAFPDIQYKKDDVPISIDIQLRGPLGRGIICFFYPKDQAHWEARESCHAVDVMDESEIMMSQYKLLTIDETINFIRIANVPPDIIDEKGYLCDYDENGNPR